MKRLEISRLMDEYTDTEFFPEGGSAADTQVVKERVLAQVTPAKKRRVPTIKVALLAAALAVGCALCVAAGLPQDTFQLFTGGTFWADVQMSGPNRHVYADLSNAFPEDPLVLEDGRLWLVLNGERTDITDLIDEETPYIVEYLDPETNLASSLILGGVPEDFGWILWQELPNGGGYSGYGHNHDTIYVLMDSGEIRLWSEELGYEENDEWKYYDWFHKPWYDNGYEQMTVFSWRR
ncbi:MAG: hypothetical protein K2M15_03455 [Oscillospiraceae bacterium]|nr:hypothetical protein [Oscillospiraceae bacterium]MDE7172353.1 hypothetical protein [Oscillospiraceae bacterium]